MEPGTSAQHRPHPILANPILRRDGSRVRPSLQLLHTDFVRDTRMAHLDLKAHERDGAGGDTNSCAATRQLRSSRMTRPRLSFRRVIVPRVSHDIGMIHVYGYRRQGGPFFIDNPRTLEEGIKSAALKDPRRRFLRAEIKDIRAMKVLWTSAPVLRPGGVR